VSTKDQENEERRVMAQHSAQRRAINNSYASLLADASIESFQAFTFEEAVDAQIERIEGAGTDIRPNLKDRTDRIRNSVVKAAEELKKIPPDQFLDKDPERDVNT
jgi:hypothetical protein